MMKRISFKTVIALLLAVAMLLPMGCGGKPAETTPESTKNEETPAVTTPAATTTNETPKESTPVESTPEASTTIETPAESPIESPVETPADTPAETTESTPAETTNAVTPEATPEPLEYYNISYDLDGGIDSGNPETYSNQSVMICLKHPIKPGYDFAGWTGTGLTEPTKDVIIGYESRGDLSFKANWVENNADEVSDMLDETYFGKDDGLAAIELPEVSVPDRIGGRGEGLFTLKTIYTDIAIDGTMDAAYTYGLHFTMDHTTNDAYYAERETTFDAYVIRGQDGFIYVYAVIVDPDLVVEEHIFNTDGAWRVDSIDMYIEIGNYGQGTKLYSFVPDMTGELVRDMPARNSITLTDTGYVAEFAFDNNGKPFFENEEIGFGFYLNDANEWDPEEKTYRKEVAKNASVLNPIGSGYMSPSAKIHDAFRTSFDSASGKVDIKDDSSAQSGDMLTDIANGTASVALVYDKYATAQTIIMIQEISAFLRGQRVDVYTVREDMADPEIKYDYKILINKTSEKATSDLMALLDLNEYGVSVTEDAIAVIGWNEEAAGLAGDILYEILDHAFGGGTSAQIGDLYKGKLEHVIADNVPVLDGFDSITDVGEDAYMMYILDSTLDEYNAYLAKLEAAGYKLYTTNTIATAQFATYYNDDSVINVEFGGENDSSLRVVVDPLSNTALPMLAPETDSASGTVVPSITQMYPHNLCLVIQLSNGHFIIVDSGNNGTQADLSKFLRSIAPDKNNIVIDAWIFTHFHQDHIGGFIDYMGISSLTRYITVESVIYNFPQWQTLNTASSLDIRNLNIFYDKHKPTMAESGTTFYQARTGQKYYFDNAVVEILWTYEDMMPFNIFTDITNHTDIGFTIEIEGHKLMVTGDSTEAEFRIAANKYGETLKSDMVQLAHHGSGNGGGAHDFYKLVNAPIVFHNRANELESNTYLPGPNELWAIYNAELVIRSGNYGTATLKLPFTIGDPIESTKEPVDELNKSEEE